MGPFTTAPSFVAVAIITWQPPAPSVASPCCLAASATGHPCRLDRDRVRVLGKGPHALAKPLALGEAALAILQQWQVTPPGQGRPLEWHRFEALLLAVARRSYLN